MGPQARDKPKILVVDDEPDNLDLLYRTFRQEYTVLRAESGSAALTLLDREGEDIAAIITDQRMPHMSGTELLSLTATRYPDTIRIILTAYTDVEDLVEAINAGKVFKYVLKPWDHEELKAVVRQAVDTHFILTARTRDLRQALRQESLLNTITNTIRSALSYRQILQTIVETLGQTLEVSCCVLRPFQDGQPLEEVFSYFAAAGHRGEGQPRKSSGPVAGDQSAHTLLAQTVRETWEIQVVHDVSVLDTSRGQSLQDLSQDLLTLRACDVHSSLTVPLICRQELMAVLALHQCGQQRTWQDDEVQLVRLVADQAALALAQARAYEQVQALAKQETLINTITTAIRSSLEPQEIFAAITQRLGEALQVDGCVLSLWTKNDEYAQCVGLYDALRQPDQPPITKTLPLLLSECQETNRLRSQEQGIAVPRSLTSITDSPVLQQLILTKQPVSLTDLNRYPEISVPDIPFPTAACSLLIVPLLADDQIIGSISLRQQYWPRQWRSTEINLAQAVAAQAAIAVQQSHLYHKTRRQAERLLEFDQQRTEFFQNISHEFRTPLTLLIGPLEAAVTQQQGLSHSQALVALRNSRRLLRLVNQLLDLQRLDAGRMQTNFRPCSLLEFTSHIVEAFRPYCDRKGIHLLTVLEDCPPVYLDTEKFDKVIFNLLSNAMKFTPVGGQITVAVRPAGDSCLLQIEDTGIGIRPDQIPHLFERFRQVDGSSNRYHEGSGLGLAIAKQFIELHGGQIAVESTWGQGTIFKIWLRTGTAHLPADQVISIPLEFKPNRAAVELADLEVELQDRETVLLKPEAPSLQTPALAGNRSGVTEPEAAGLASSLDILVVEDNSDLRSYIAQLLQEAGYSVCTACNGGQGFQLIQHYHPQLVITDLMMPIASGLDLIAQTRAEEQLRRTPIILLTAKTEEDARIEGAEFGADAYLTKPFNTRELLATVRNLLALKASERQVAELNTYLTESVLRRFLPPPLVRKAALGELVLDLHPEPKLVTILFSDIVDFAQLANTLRSRRAAELLNEYLGEMTRAVFDNGGTVDKFMGDAVMALFGPPGELTSDEQVRRAVAAAHQMQRSLNKLNQWWQEQGVGPLLFRCGIHQGTAVVGMFGSQERSDYTAIGPSVNIAARLQEAAEPGTILVSAAVADYLQDEEITKCSPLHFKGIDETVLTFAVKLGSESSQSQSED